MGRNFIFFINPMAGTSAKKNLPDIIGSRCREKNFAYEILNTNAKGDYTFLKEKTEKNKITDIIICGGDGTISKIVSFLVHSNISIGIIPLGSGNGLAFTAGIPVNIHKAIDIIFNNNAVWTDGIYINNNFSCMLCGLGFDAVVAHGFAQQTSRGFVTYLSESLKNFTQAKTYNFNLKINGERFDTKAFFISFANSNQFGNHVTIAPKASLCDGLTDLVIVPEMSKPKLIYSLLKQIFSGKPSSNYEKEQNNILYYQSSIIEVENKDLAPLHIDGEPAESQKNFLIKNCPQAFKLLQPVMV